MILKTRRSIDGTFKENDNENSCPTTAATMNLPGRSRDATLSGDNDVLGFGVSPSESPVGRTGVEILGTRGRTIVRNKILAGLPLADFAAIGPRLELVELQPRMILKDTRKANDFAYFMEAGLVSLRIVSDGCIFEIAIVGHEGAVGLSSLIGADIPNHQFVSVFSGRAFRIRFEDLHQLAATRPLIKERLFRYVAAQHVHCAQMGLCGVRHELEKRVACWLCLASDALGGPTVAVTQEYLSNGLGLRRPSVTKALACFEKEFLIRKERGVLYVKDRDGLQRRACTCYGFIAKAYSLAEASDRDGDREKTLSPFCVSSCKASASTDTSAIF
ncbi:CRP-like cAMP-binding protein [Bradyrhizobium diazoefficiens]|uniref:Crp/Fnr family transcriptional regulator n=1 Tax=Bradyrhizobium diazoefficiens TaxID=1355477 RepID=UPI003513A816